MPGFGADQQQGYDAGAASVQAAAPGIGAGRSFRTSANLDLTFVVAATPGSESVGRTDKSHRITLAGSRAGITSDPAARGTGICCPDNLAPMTCLTIGWSIAVPDT